MFRRGGSPKGGGGKWEGLAPRFGGRIVSTRGNPPQFLVVPDGAASTVVAFNTDVPHLESLGKPLLFGPGSILDAHGEMERIAKLELLASVDVYRQTVKQLLGS